MEGTINKLKYLSNHLEKLLSNITIDDINRLSQGEIELLVSHINSMIKLVDLNAKVYSTAVKIMDDSTKEREEDQSGIGHNPVNIIN